MKAVKLAVGNLSGKRIAALGLAYKPDVDDLRESPANEVIHLLQAEGAQVIAFEPFKPEAALPGIKSAATLKEALAEADAVILLVKHSQFAALTPSELASLTSARLVLDTVNAWASPTWAQAGFQVYRLGVG